MPLRLETERLMLTPENEHDAEWLATLVSARGTGQLTVENAREWIAEVNATIEATGIGALVLRVKPHCEPIGYCAIIVGRSSLAEPEIAYELLPEAHGHGYATGAARAVVDAAFATGRARIWSTVGAWNAPSLRVLDNPGFRRSHSTVDAEGEVIWLVRDAP